MEPDKLRFSKTHEWVHLEGDTATIGITDYAVAELSEPVNVDLPKAGTRVQQGTPFGEIESVKAVSDLYAPVSGEVVDVNAELIDNLQWLSDDAFGKGWMLKVRVDAGEDHSQLMDYEAYQESHG